MRVCQFRHSPISKCQHKVIRFVFPAYHYIKQKFTEQGLAQKLPVQYQNTTLLFLGCLDKGDNRIAKNVRRFTCQ